jgi:phosphoglycerate-specific signal transduction histidine kinase
MEDNLILVVSVLASLSALVLSVFNLRSLERPLKRSAAIAADVLQLAEPWIPALRNSQIDNYLRDVLRAYAASDPFFTQALKATGQDPDHVADVLPVLDPELKTLGKAIGLPVDKSRALMTNLVHRVKDYDQAVERIREDLEHSLDPLQSK